MSNILSKEMIEQEYIKCKYILVNGQRCPNNRVIRKQNESEYCSDHNSKDYRSKYYKIKKISVYDKDEINNKITKLKDKKIIINKQIKRIDERINNFEKYLNNFEKYINN